MSTAASSDEHGPWNPGISSDLPRAYLKLSTMFRPENVHTSLAEAHELSDVCGLAAHELVAFRTERPILHQLLIRVTADLNVPDGSHYGDLGINFREIVANILSKYIAPRVPEIERLHKNLNGDAASWIEIEFTKQLFPRHDQGNSKTGRKKSRFRLFGFGAFRSAPPEPEKSLEETVIDSLDLWAGRSAEAQSPFEQACREALGTIVGAIMSKRGQLVGGPSLITSLATNMVCNSRGSEMIGQVIDPIIRRAVAEEGYRLLPRQNKPVVMNVKGASAAGKSTMRPLQHRLADRLDIPWRDFALISPDIWRKFLLDYHALGDAYKYAGALSGHEVEIIDRKLDHYMANKAAAGKMTHLLIDRFRFDSFVPETEGDEDSKLLTRFGDLVYMFFVITPPHATVERAWKRGEIFGRYKAIDDLLDHNIEAFTGMPQLFFTWALHPKKRVHYEFLDNSVPKGEQPRTVAFGWNGEIKILDIKSMLDIDRFRKININATDPDQVYDLAKMTPEDNVEFLQQCARLIPAISFVDRKTGYHYARLERGKWTWRDEKHLAWVMTDPDARAGLEAIGMNGGDFSDVGEIDQPELEQDKVHTLGAWGGEAG